jgi:aminocarboxymuconate-semialdehyde decarboxylase
MRGEYNKSTLLAMGPKSAQKISTSPFAWARRAAFRYLSAAELYNRNGFPAKIVNETITAAGRTRANCCSASECHDPVANGMLRRVYSREYQARNPVIFKTAKRKENRMSPVIDVHTHMLNEAWFDLLQKHGKPRYTVEQVKGGLSAIHLDGAPFMTPVPAMFDYEMRIRNMNKAGIDISIVSLTCPNVYWGGAEVSLKAAKLMNDDMAKAQRTYPDRIRWFASLPWQYPALAVKELTRATKAGAVGVMVLANIDGEHLTNPRFAPIWKAIDKLKLPVLVHPTAPPGVANMQMNEFQLTASLGFTFDTSLALARMVYDGFFDRHLDLKIIASHGGGALPFLAGRLDQCYDHIPACRVNIAERPSQHLRNVYCDTVVFRQDALNMAVSCFGTDNVLYGSDYPHTIGDPIGCLALVDALPDGVRDKVRSRNAQRIFNL